MFVLRSATYFTIVPLELSPEIQNKISNLFSIGIGKLRLVGWNLTKNPVFTPYAVWIEDLGCLPEDSGCLPEDSGSLPEAGLYLLNHTSHNFIRPRYVILPSLRILLYLKIFTCRTEKMSNLILLNL